MESRREEVSYDSVMISNSSRKLHERPSAKEIARRHRAVARILRAREKTPRLEISTAELVRRARQESERFDG